MKELCAVQHVIVLHTCGSRQMQKHPPRFLDHLKIPFSITNSLWLSLHAPQTIPSPTQSDCLWPSRRECYYHTLANHAHLTKVVGRPRPLQRCPNKWGCAWTCSTGVCSASKPYAVMPTGCPALRKAAKATPDTPPVSHISTCMIRTTLLVSAQKQEDAWRMTRDECMHRQDVKKDTIYQLRTTHADKQRDD